MCDFNANLGVFIMKVIFSIEVGFNLSLPLTKLKSDYKLKVVVSACRLIPKK